MAKLITCTAENPYKRDAPGAPRNSQRVHPVRDVEHVGVTMTTSDCDMGGLDYDFTCPNCGEQWTVDGPDA